MSPKKNLCLKKDFPEWRDQWTEYKTVVKINFKKYLKNILILVLIFLKKYCFKDYNLHQQSPGESLGHGSVVTYGRFV